MGYLYTPRVAAYLRGTLQGHPWHARAHDVLSCERPLKIGCLHSAHPGVRFAESDPTAVSRFSYYAGQVEKT